MSLDWLPGKRLIMTLPLNGEAGNAVHVYELTNDDLSLSYMTTNMHGFIDLVHRDKVRVFNRAFNNAAWDLRVRQATEADYR